MAGIRAFFCARNWGNSTRQPTGYNFQIVQPFFCNRVSVGSGYGVALGRYLSQINFSQTYSVSGPWQSLEDHPATFRPSSCPLGQGRRFLCTL